MATEFADIDNDRLTELVAALVAGNKWRSCRANGSDVEYHKTQNQAIKRCERDCDAIDDRNGGGWYSIDEEILINFCGSNAPDKEEKQFLRALGLALLRASK